MDLKNANAFGFIIIQIPYLLILLLISLAVSDGDSSVGSLSHVEMSEVEGGFWPDHHVVNDDTHDCDSVGSNVVQANPDSSPPVTASDEMIAIILKVT